MKLAMLLLLSVMSFNSFSSIIYNFEEIEMRNDNDSSRSGLLSGFIQYDSVSNVNSLNFEKLEFIFSFGTETVILSEDYLNGISIVDLDDGFFGNTNGDSDEGFEFVFELENYWVTLSNGFFGLGRNDTCFDLEDQGTNDFTVYCAGSLITVTGPDNDATSVNSPGSFALFALAICGLVGIRARS